jgi:hypothetical protein
MFFLTYRSCTFPNFNHTNCSAARNWENAVAAGDPSDGEIYTAARQGLTGRGGLGFLTSRLPVELV